MSCVCPAVVLIGSVAVVLVGSVTEVDSPVGRVSWRLLRGTHRLLTSIQAGDITNIIIMHA